MNDNEAVEQKTKFDIPGKKEVFQALVSGMHISLHTGELYRYLQEHPNDYKNELRSLGYSLVEEQDYFYLQVQGESKTNDFSRRCQVFIAIMIESIANDGLDVLEAFFRLKGFERDQLPHFSTERYKNYMQHLELNNEKQLNIHLKNMHRSGFIDYNETESYIQFLTPCHRFLQLSLEILQKHQQENRDDAS